MPATAIRSSIVPSHTTEEMDVSGKQRFGEKSRTIGEETVVEKCAFEDEMNEGIKGVPDEEEAGFGVCGGG